MVYTELNSYDMQEMLKVCDRNNFSIDALQGYIDFIDMLGESAEFDPVGFDCSFIECSKDMEALSDYTYLIYKEDYADEEDRLDALLDALRENTLVVWEDNNSILFDYNF